MSFRSRFLASTTGTLAAVAIVRAPVRAAQFTYRLGHPQAISFPPHVRLVQMAAAVRSETNGRLEIQIFPNSMLGSDTSMFEQLRVGSIQMFWSLNANFARLIPVSAIDAVGFAFSSPGQPLAALDGALGTYLRREFAAKGLYAFDRALETGWRHVTTSNRPINAAADFTGLKIRTPSSPIFLDLFRTLGASPIPMDSNELYVALQTHIAEGQEQSLAAIESLRTYEVQKYLSLTNHIWGGSWLLMNGEAYGALPPDVQSVLRRNVEKYTLLERRDMQMMNAPLTDKLKRQGLAFNTADGASMRARLGPYYAKWKAEFGATAWGLLENVTGKLI